MKIGIIGIGEIGGTLAARWSRNGHSVRVANSRGPEAAIPFAEEIGAIAVDIRGAVEGAEIVLLSMPFPAVASLPNDLFHRAPADLVIIDTANYYPDVRDPRIGELDAGMPESVWVLRQLGRPVFKAFNSIMSYALSELGRPEGARTGWPSPSPATAPGASGSSWIWSMKPDLILSMPARWTSPGVSSLQHPPNAATMAQPGRSKASRLQSKAGPRPSATPNGGRNM